MHVSVCIHESISITSIRPMIYMIGLVLYIKNKVGKIVS